jgi:hypothetical protein
MQQQGVTASCRRQQQPLLQLQPAPAVRTLQMLQRGWGSKRHAQAGARRLRGGVCRLVFCQRSHSLVLRAGTLRLLRLQLGQQGTSRNSMGAGRQVNSSRQLPRELLTTTMTCRVWRLRSFE